MHEDLCRQVRVVPAGGDLSRRRSVGRLAATLTSSCRTGCPPPGREVYTPIVPNHGLYESRVLCLDFQVHKDRLWFYAGTALLLESDELITRMQEWPMRL